MSRTESTRRQSLFRSLQQISLPERDIALPPILEARHLGIDFGGLTAVS